METRLNLPPPKNTRSTGKSVTIDMYVMERVSGKFGIDAMMTGLRTMKSWCEDNAPGYRYVKGTARFMFAEKDHADAFRTQFGDALYPPETSQAKQ